MATIDVSVGQGFDETYYLAAKAAQLTATTGQSWNVAQTLAAIQAAGLTPEEHYSMYGYNEGLSPNEFYNDDEYVASKADAANITPDQLRLDWYNASGSSNMYTHYMLYGAFEANVNPSTGFDDEDYYAAKAAQMGAGTTPEQAEAAIKAAGMNAISHYLLYGKNESLAFTPTPTPTPGQTFTLTTGLDVIPGLIGSAGTTSTAGDDTIVGTWTDTGVVFGGTLNLGDNLDAGAGINTLQLTTANTIAGATTTTVTGFTAANVQKVFVKATGTAAGNTTTYDATTTTAGTEFWNNGSSRAVIFDNIQQNAAIGLMGGTSQSVSATFKDSVVTGSSDTATVKLNGAGDTNTAPGNTINLQGKTTGTAGFETINLVSNTAASRIGTLETGNAGAVLETLNISGDASVRIDNVNSSALKTINASTMTGTAGVNVDASATARTDLKFTGTANNDRLSLDGLNTANTFNLNGGTGGTDTLAVEDAIAFTQTGSATFVNTVNNQTTGFEVLETANAATVAVKANDFTAINQFKFGVSATAAAGQATITTTGVETPDTFTFGADQTGTTGNVGGATASAATDALAFTGATPGQTANIVLSAQTGVDIVGGAAGAGQAGASSAAAGAVADSAIAFGGAITTLTINSTGTTANTIVGGAGGTGGVGASAGAGGAGGAAAVAIDNGASVQSVTITGDKDLTIAGGAAGAAGASGGGNSGGAGGAASLNAFSNSVAVTATDFTGKLTIAGSSAADTIAVGSGGSVLNATQGMDGYTFGAGNDTLIYTNVNQSLTSVADDAAILNSIDKVSDWGTGTDKLNVAAVTGITGGGFTSAEYVAQNVVQAAVDAVGPTSLLQASQAAAANLGADKIGTFTYGGNTYMLGQDNAAAFAATDLFVQIAGTNTLTASNFTFA
uniref:Calcium-binding protein n=1 Tax=Desulfovibrio sp. U5L TaxID=596152 RepID=I2Q7Q6_9BACT